MVSKSKLKIAILLYKPIKMPPSGYEFLNLIMAHAFQKLEHEVKIFAIGKENNEIKIEKNLEEKIIKGTTYPEEGLTFSRLKDFFTLYVFGYRSSIKTLNNNENVIKELEKYAPDIIVVSSIQIGELAQKIKRQLKKTKVIVYTDSYELIKASFNSITYAKLPRILKTAIIALLKEKYVKYMFRLYKNLIKVGDIIVTPTEKDKMKISRRFKIKSDKIFVIPPILIKGLPKKVRKINKIKTITFIGVANYGPNIEAVNAIKEKIAPKLKDIKFLIVGKGWEKEKKENIEVLGEVKDLKAVFDKTDAFIAPIKSGAGMKTKIATYLDAGKPIIGTTVAFEGYNIKDKVNGIIEDNIEAMPNRISKFITNSDQISKIQRNSKKIANSFSEKSITKLWNEVLLNAFR